MCQYVYVLLRQSPLMFLEPVNTKDYNNNYKVLKIILILWE